MTGAGGRGGLMDLKDPVVSTAVLLHKVHLIQPSPPHPPIHNYDYNELLTGGEIPNSGVSIKPRAVQRHACPIADGKHSVEDG
jgi:hypothetical protein